MVSGFQNEIKMLQTPILLESTKNQVSEYLIKPMYQSYNFGIENYRVVQCCQHRHDKTDLMWDPWTNGSIFTSHHMVQ